jgi:hypothetical protein
MRKTLMIGFVALLLILPLVRAGADERQDLLLMQVYDGQGTPSFSVYDAAAHTTTPLPDYIVPNAQLSADGRLAYSVTFEGQIEAHIWDSNHPDQLSTAIMADGDGDQYTLMWSPDGRLAFKAVPDADGNQRQLYVWDGVTSENITPPDITGKITEYERMAWSPEGHYLAFGLVDTQNIRHFYVWDGAAVVPIYVESDVNFSEYALTWSTQDRLALSLSYFQDSPNTIYVWDGHNMMRLSQNPTQYPVWSADGRLAFASWQDGWPSILVWDGVSVSGGQPDASTFINASPDLSVGFSAPVWTSQDHVAFEAQSSQDRFNQIYVWDGEKATNISRNPRVGNSNAVWNQDGRWSFTSVSSQQNFVYVRDADNQSVLMTKGYGFASKPVWSSNGNLVFCRSDSPDWVLSVWDGQTVTEVVRAESIFAQWQNGSNIICSSG